ncbi:MAG: phosphatase PAP2 family protein [Nocardioidaceae bacterium]
MAAFVVAVVENLPFRDPDSLVGPTYVRLPTILGLAFLTDVLPRALHRSHRAGSVRRAGSEFVAVTRERWSGDHVRFALLGLGSWYLTYVAFRNLKSYVPFVNPRLFDDAFARIDRVLFLGHDPAVLLHDLLGTGWAAHAMSLIYVAWIAMVPGVLASALVWSRDVSGGSWLVTAVGVDWVLGVATYFVFPTVGPIYAEPAVFETLAHTSVTTIQRTMIAERIEVLADPWATHAVQTIAAFASLHVGITVTVCVIAHLLRLHVWVRTALWVFLFLTVLSTVYLGWHYSVDALGGAVLGITAVWVGALATGNHVRGRPMHRQSSRSSEAVVSR